MIVSAARHDLGIPSVADVLTDDPPVREVEHRAGNGLQRTGRNQRRIHRGVVAGGNSEALVEHAVYRAFAGQVEDGMIGEIDHRGGIGGGRIVKA